MCSRPQLEAGMNRNTAKMRTSDLPWMKCVSRRLPLSNTACECKCTHDISTQIQSLLSGAKHVLLWDSCTNCQEVLTPRANKNETRPGAHVTSQQPCTWCKIARLCFSLPDFTQRVASHLNAFMKIPTPRKVMLGASSMYFLHGLVPFSLLLLLEV